MKKFIPQKAIIKDEDRFLILKRSNLEEVFPGLWDFPGGKLEKGEDPEVGIMREVKEETGLNVVPQEVCMTHDVQLEDIQIHFVIYEVKVISQNIKDVHIGPEHAEFRFATASEIRELPRMPYIDNILNKQTKN